MMRFKITFFLAMILLLAGSVFAGNFTPQGDIALRNTYRIWDAVNISSSYLYVNGTLTANNLSVDNYSLVEDDIPTLSSSWANSMDSDRLTGLDFLDDKINLQGENITGGTISFTRLPSLTNATLLDVANISNLDNSHTLSADNLTTGLFGFDVNSSEGNFPLLNGAYYVLVGNGSDLQTKINNGANNIIFIPCGDYFLDSTVGVNYDNVSIVGSGSCTRIYRGGGDRAFSVPSDNIVFKDFSLDLNGTGFGIAYVNGEQTGLLISNVEIRNTTNSSAGTAIILGDASNSSRWFHNVVIESVRLFDVLNGIHLAGNNSFVFNPTLRGIGNLTTGAGEYGEGIELNTFLELPTTIIGGEIRDFGEEGIDCNNAYCKISGVTIYGSNHSQSSVCITVGMGNNSIVQGNTLINCKTNALLLNNVVGGTYSHNVMVKNMNYAGEEAIGIRMASGGNYSISDNFIAGYHEGIHTNNNTYDIRGDNNIIVNVTHVSESLDYDFGTLGINGEDLGDHTIKGGLNVTNSSSYSRFYVNSDTGRVGINIGSGEPRSVLEVQGNLTLDGENVNNRLIVGRYGGADESVQIWSEDQKSVIATVQDESATGPEGTLIIRLDDNASGAEFIVERANGTDLFTSDLEGNFSVGEGSLFFDNINNILSVSGFVSATEYGGGLNWSYLQNYPASCVAGSALSALNDSVTCTSFLLSSGGVLSGSLNMSGNNVSDVNSVFLDEVFPYSNELIMVNNTDLVVNTTSGFVGIGTTGPGAKLHVSGGGNIYQIIESTSTGAVGLKLQPFSASADERDWRIGAYLNDVQQLSIQSSDTKGGSSFTSRMVIDAISGNVGIGTTGPGAKLDVNSTDSVGQLIVRGYSTIGGAHNSNGLLAIGGGGVNTQGQIDYDYLGGQTALRLVNKYSNVAAVVALRVNGADRLTVLGSGNVGIGTTSPTYPLEVNNSVSGISIWSQQNVSAEDYLTRTSVYDQTKGNALNYIQDSNYYTTNGNIDHKKFYGYAGKANTTDYERPETDYYEEEECNTTNNITVCGNVTKTRTIYPYNKEVEQISLNKEIDLLRQAVYELKQKIIILEEKTK